MRHGCSALALTLGVATWSGSACARPQREFTAVPLVGGDTDAGFGGGYMASFATLAPDLEPYRFRIESATVATFKTDQPFSPSYVDSYLKLDWPHLIAHRLRLSIRLSYTRETRLNYYGIGNATQIASASDPAFYRYERIHPTLQANLEYKLGAGLKLTWGASYTQNWLRVPATTKLAEDIQGGSDTERRLLGDAAPHAAVLFSYGLAWDTRDDEVSPQRGFYHTARIDLGPGAGKEVPHRWARFDGALRAYVGLVPRRLTFAARVVGDFLFGDAPLYELPRYDSTSAIGGASGVRGIPAQRYYGRIKLFGNFELRSELFHFRLFSKENRFGLTGFFDTGRVFSDYHAEPTLDGHGIGLKSGGGIGVRLAAGQSFVLRLDTAWSDKLTPSAAYLGSGHVF